MPADPITATEPPVQTEQPRWLRNPDFLRLWLRMFVDADAIGGIPAVVKLVRSLSEGSGTPPKVILATVRTYLLEYDPEHITLH
jgi:hypothetical protein